MKNLERSAGKGRGHAGAALLVAGVLGFGAASAIAEGRNVDGILDNSFLVEEAYNQEAGVVQHIFTALYGVDREAGADSVSLAFAFTQEWPLFSQTHQLSYTVPYNFVRGGGQSDDGVGDVLLNYRYQAWFDERTLRAFAPRFSLILPTGDKRLGFGEDTLGYQINLPFSTALGDKAFAHLNAGATLLPDAASAVGRDLWHFNLGASAIYAATRDLHFLVEWVGGWNQTPQPGGNLRHEFSAVISPGLRKAFNFDGGAQVVVGVAVPVGLTGDAPDYGVFLYLSIEHSFRRSQQKP
ncbi:MAG: transporter [Pedosphaera sp.]|nr:transporter [Pedosphaera sp.]